MGSIALGALLAILSQVSQIGKGLQKEGVKSLPELSFDSALQVCAFRLASLRAYRESIWDLSSVAV